jgi:carbon-monoxide dehydrogenase small subunit
VVGLTVTVNGVQRSVAVEGRTLLVDLLRNELGLTGTKVGCDTSQCGACTVLVDSRAVKSCTLLALQVADASVTTIEGLASGPELHALQRSFRDHHALQCGFCTPGMILTAVDLRGRGDELSREALRDALEGNLCRCTGYQPIVDAILAVPAG